MHTHIGCLSVIGFLISLAAANAQAPSPAAAGMPFDGTYRLVSAANVNATYTSRKGQTGLCPSRRAGPLHIVNGRVHYNSATGLRVAGTVGPQGELAMRAEGPSRWGNQPVDLSVSGNIDANGSAHVRQLSHSCSYDFVWQKASR
jgi:hypothetical protein